MYESVCIACFRDTGSDMTCPHCGYVESGRRKTTFLPARYVLQDRYLIGEVIHADKNGICYKAQDLQTQRIVEVQEHFPREVVMRDSDGVSVVPLANGDDAWPRKNELDILLQNANTMKRFSDCEGIVKVFDAFKANRTVYIVNEYMEGMTLEDYLQSCGGTVDVETAVSIIVPVLDGLTKLHNANLIHRAVTPKNIIITSDNTIKLINYVFLKETSPFKESEMTVYFSPGYAPYEQYVSKERRGPYSDVYSAGAVLYRMLIGKAPQDPIERKNEDDLPEILRDASLPEYIVLCISKAMHMNKDIRIKSAADMKNTLLQQIELEDVDARLDDISRRRQTAWLIGLIAVLAAVIVVLVIVLQKYY